MKRPGWRSLAGAALVIAGVAALRASVRPQPADPPSLPPVPSAPTPPRSAGPAELALVAPLVPGSSLAGFGVREIQGVERGWMRVVCVKDRATVTLYVALTDPEGVVPPATAGRFAVYYGLRGAAPDEGERLAKQLAGLIHGNPDAPPPPGMTTFAPGEKPGTPL